MKFEWKMNSTMKYETHSANTFFPHVSRRSRRFSRRLRENKGKESEIQAAIFSEISKIVDFLQLTETENCTGHSTAVRNRNWKSVSLNFTHPLFQRLDFENNSAVL